MKTNNLSDSQRKILDRELIKLYCKDNNIAINHNITSHFQHNKKGDTMAMWLVKQCKLIPRQWMHNYNIRNKNGKTLKDMMIESSLPIPQHWENDEDMTIFDQAYFGIIPNIAGHQPDEQNEQGYTVAMILAYNDVEIPKEWYHNPTIQNNQGNTVAQFQALRGKIPDKQWQHDSSLQTKGGNTVAMRLAYHGIIPPKQWEHDPNLQNINGWTVAMNIAYYCKCIPEQQWNHSPTVQDSEKWTVAMMLARQEIIPPKQWYHTPELQNKHGWTVAMFIAFQLKQIPPKQWMHDITLHAEDNITLNYLLQIGKYIKINKQKTFNCSYETKNDICQICFKEGQQQFVKTICGHNICKQCFQNCDTHRCPICRKENWYTLLSDELLDKMQQEIVKQ